ncbi:uncharacterized protein BKA55DRAFT_629674 [Fusarium redolens]|uniref:Zn(2)-C6 fungal-type domain-containing protein n=1 Tax=Fusarium redolens TaxID=48865 RepID=A0A9P9R8C2_FUSRE|nr:uncharacterized protein BKA55DRAFT_629674 [Fusarium redolens]KAH7269063.1 hypothetical protein BKA55DRAFT_629674 [Fusarium redolens]
MRQAHCKVKTGCLTCKIRRVKCDEKKPACHRCTSTGRKCDGYTLVQKTNPPDVAHGRMLLPPVSAINSQSLLPVEERRALRYFHSVISPRLSSARDGYFWTHLVMQLSESEVVVKHTILSISSLFESSEGKNVAPYTERFALQHYTAAIQRLKTIHSEPLVLLVCILFICVEYLLANNKIALQHCQHGLAIMEKCSNPWARRHLLPVFRRMTAVPMLFGPEDIESESMPALTYMIPTKFYCMEDAQYMMDDIFNRVVRLCHMRHRGVVFDMTEEYNTVATHLQTWQTLFEKLEVDTTSLLYQAQERSLFMRLKLCYLELCADFRPDEHMGTFRQVLQLASWQSQRSTKQSTYELAYTPMLFFVIMKCPDLSIRLPALRLMKQLGSPTEGLCENLQMLTTSREIIQDEHKLEIINFDMEISG